MIGFLATACCATPPPALQFSWHLIREPEFSGPAGETSGSAGGGAPIDQPSARPAPLARHHLFLTVLNTGPIPLSVPGLTVTGGKSVQRRGPMTLVPGEVRVIDLDTFNCWVPVSVTLAGSTPSEKGPTLYLPAVPSGFPEQMDISCPWAK
jgi:hypothetical protein